MVNSYKKNSNKITSLLTETGKNHNLEPMKQNKWLDKNTISTHTLPQMFETLIFCNEFVIISPTKI